MTEEEAKNQSDIHNHAIHGNSLEVGLMPLAHDQEENNPNGEKHKKKRADDAEFLRMSLEAQEAYNDLMSRLDVELKTLQAAIDETERQMENNRLQWEQKAGLLNDIDDIFSDFENGGVLDRTKATEIIRKSDIEIQEGATDAQMISLLQEIRQQTFSGIEILDVNYSNLEKDHKRFRAREDIVIEAKQKLEAISNDSSLNHAQRLQAIQELDNEIGSKTLHAAATVIQDQEIAHRADKVVKNDWDANRSENVVAPLSPPAI